MRYHVQGLSKQINEQPDMADGQPKNIMLLLTLLVGKGKMTSLDSTTQKTWGIP